MFHLVIEQGFECSKAPTSDSVSSVFSWALFEEFIAVLVEHDKALARRKRFKTTWDAGKQKEYKTATKEVNYIHRTLHFMPFKTKPFASKTNIRKWPFLQRESKSHVMSWAWAACVKKQKKEANVGGRRIYTSKNATRLELSEHKMNTPVLSK